MSARTNKASSHDGKAAYTSRNLAVAAIGSFARRTGANMGRLVAYRCVHCRDWHIGNRSKPRR